jgi:hypothetical protein
MRAALALVMSGVMLGACSPASNDQNPRDRKGAQGALTWRIVAQADGQAAFLSRPGAAPDLVLWCKDNGLLTLRAHVFEDPKPQPDLTLTTDGATAAFQNVRRQGGVRDGDRKLVEGTIPSSDGKLSLLLSGATNLTVKSGGVEFSARNTDPNTVLPAFTQACTGKLLVQGAKK